LPEVLFAAACFLQGMLMFWGAASVVSWKSWKTVSAFLPETVSISDGYSEVRATLAPVCFSDQILTRTSSLIAALLVPLPLEGPGRQRVTPRAPCHFFFFTHAFFCLAGSGRVFRTSDRLTSFISAARKKAPFFMNQQVISHPQGLTLPPLKKGLRSPWDDSLRSFL